MIKNVKINRKCSKINKNEKIWIENAKNELKWTKND